MNNFPKIIFEKNIRIMDTLTAIVTLQAPAYNLVIVGHILPETSSGLNLACAPNGGGGEGRTWPKKPGPPDPLMGWACPHHID
jgi:hypothetical protein